jgi:Fuc2NAc and GlcNAc transferase
MLLTSILVLGAFFTGAVLVSASVTALTLRYTTRNNILDVPNARSSHTHPTPRGGGVAIVGVVIATLLGLVACGMLPAYLGLSLLLSSVMIAALGLADDLYHLSPRVRLAVQGIAAGIVVCGIVPFDVRVVSGTLLLVALLGALLLTIATVWMTNLYNFMDGIDGIAGIQATVAALSAAVLLYQSGWQTAAVLAVSIGGASVGFLIFNWSPARIFMGDVGSSFLGFMFAALAIMGYGHAVTLSLLLIMPLLPFVIDATMTLLLRLARGAPAATAHREHVYQLAVQAGLSHKEVAGTVGAYSVVLALVAWSTVHAPQRIPVVFIAATCATIGGHGLLRFFLLRTSRARLHPHTTTR